MNLACAILPLKSAPIGNRCGPKTWWAASPTRPAFARPWPPPKNACERVGIDSEITGSVKIAALARHLHARGNERGCARCRESEQRAAATLIFSAKEAFYKCQFAADAERLGFHDVSVELPAMGQKRGAFKVMRQSRHGSSKASAALPLQGRYLFHEEFITTGIALPALLSFRVRSVRLVVAKHFHHGQQNDFDIEHRRPMPQIIEIVVDACFHFFEFRGLAAAAVDLRKPVMPGNTLCRTM